MRMWVFEIEKIEQIKAGLFSHLYSRDIIGLAVAENK